MATPDRVAALSEQLIQVHQSLRERLIAFRRAAAAVGEAADAPGRPAATSITQDLAVTQVPVITQDLLSHCLGFCSAIHAHHTGEDGQLLPALRAAQPGLAPVIDNLMEDHRLVAGILQRIRELLAPGHGQTDPARPTGQPRPARPARPADPAALLRELDGLTAILDSHFGYEERRIARALDTLGSEAWTADVFAPGPATPAPPG